MLGRMCGSSASCMPGVSGKCQFGGFANEASVHHGSVGRFSVWSNRGQLKERRVLQFFVCFQRLE